MSGAIDENATPSDQPSLIYAFDDGDEIREISRSSGTVAEAATHGDAQLRGEIIDRDNTRSNPTDGMPVLDLPGLDGLVEDDCGEDIPVLACGDCGHPVYVGRTCQCPRCERCWPAAVKNKVIRYGGKLDGLRRKLYAKHDGRRDIDFNHVVASLPDVLVDSSQPKERVLEILKTLLEEQWGVEGFAAIYHPYRIKQEYRDDQYDHGGESGEGDMTWADVLNSDNPDEYTKFEPHFHLFFPAVRQSFDYVTAEAIYEQSGWVFHRITKSGEDDNRSVSDFADLVYQLIYCMSHVGVEEVADRSELATRMKGDLHNCYKPDGIEDQAMAVVADAAPKLLGHKFVNTADKSCDADIDEGSDAGSSGSSAGVQGHGPSDTRDLDASAAPSGSRSVSSDGWEPSGAATGASGGRQSDNSQQSVDASSDDQDASGGGSKTRTCGGDLIPMHQAQYLIKDANWCEQADHADGLRVALEEWERRCSDNPPSDDDPPPGLSL